MGTIADKLTHLGQTKVAIRDAIISKGVAVPVEATFREYAGKIREITADDGGINPEEEWKRPDDWLPIEELVVAGDQKFVGLHAIFEDSNFVALSATGNYTVDWGDGKIENYTSGVQANHTYSYDAFAGTETTRGYRQAIVTVMPQVGENLTSVSLQRRHSQFRNSTNYSTGWLDIRLSGQHLTSLILGGVTVRCSFLESFCFLGSNSVTDFTRFFSGCYALQAVPFFDTSKGINFSFMFQGAVSLQSVPLLDTSKGTNFSSMFQGCGRLRTIPLLDVSKGTNFSNLFYNCNTLQKVPLLNTANGTDFRYMFAECSLLETIPLLDTSKGTVFDYMFGWGSLLKQIPLLNTAKGTSFYCMFGACRMLETIPLLDTSNGSNFSFMFQNCTSLKTVPALNTVNGTSFYGMFGYCSKLQAIPLLDTSKGTNFGQMFISCFTLERLPLLNGSSGTAYDSIFSNCGTLSKATFLGTKNTISYVDCKLSRAALVDIFNNLASGVTSKTITITNNWGVSFLTPEDRDIALKKGWIIVE